MTIASSLSFQGEPNGSQRAQYGQIDLGGGEITVFRKRIAICVTIAYVALALLVGYAVSWPDTISFFVVPTSLPVMILVNEINKILGIDITQGDLGYVFIPCTLLTLGIVYLVGYGLGVLVDKGSKVPKG